MITPLLVSICVAVAAAYPCTCILGPPLTTRAAVSETVGHAAGVFEGTVVALVRAQDSIADESTGRFLYWDAVHATVVVRRRWKGALSDTVIVRTPEQTTMCGFDFKEGTRYLIVASLTPSGHFTTSKCVPTLAWGRDAGVAVRFLGPPQQGPVKPTR